MSFDCATAVLIMVILYNELFERILWVCSMYVCKSNDVKTVPDVMTSECRRGDLVSYLYSKDLLLALSSRGDVNVP